VVLVGNKFEENDDGPIMHRSAFQVEVCGSFDVSHCFPAHCLPALRLSHRPKVEKKVCSLFLTSFVTASP